MARIQIDDIRKELEKDGWKLISTEYHNLDENLEFLCDENHHVFAPWKKIRVRRECPVCKANPYKEMKIGHIPKKKGTFRILALDQATKISGFSLLDNKKLVKYGIYTAPEINDEIERDHQIKQWLISMINNWEVDYILSHDTYSSHPLAHKYETDMSLYGDDYYDLHDCLETVEKKTDYKMWFSGHYHDDMIHYSDSNKPCLTLFDKVLLLDNIDEEIKSLTKI